MVEQRDRLPDPPMEWIGTVPETPDKVALKWQTVDDDLGPMRWAAIVVDGREYALAQHDAGPEPGIMVYAHPDDAKGGLDAVCSAVGLTKPDVWHTPMGLDALR